MTSAGQLAERMTVTRLPIWPLIRELVRTLNPAYSREDAPHKNPRLRGKTLREEVAT